MFRDLDYDWLAKRYENQVYVPRLSIHTRSFNVGTPSSVENIFAFVN